MNPRQCTAEAEATRSIILHAAFHSFFRYGYQGTSLKGILKQTGFTKGALFYHFSNKMSVAYAVLDEIIEPMMVDIWLLPLDARSHPITAIQTMLQQAPMRMKQHFGKEHMRSGCPLQHFSEEMAQLDDGIQERCQRIFRRWQSGIAGVLTDAKQQGLLRADLDEENIAIFLIATMEGAISMGKQSSTMAGYFEVLHGASEQLSLYIDSLRA